MSFYSSLLNLNGSEMDDNYKRVPYPYVMFKGKENIYDHNSIGYKFNENLPADNFRIAFYGGSTGYNGDPTIVEIIASEISKNSDLKFSALNFSIPASNHNQHLHSLLEFGFKYKPDIIIFYGGYNETLLTARYDPRPGFPYNFYIRNELAPEIMLLLKHSVLSRSLIFTTLGKKLVGINNEVFSPEWNKKIVNNYFSVIEKSKMISEKIVSGRCKNFFISFYQPYNMSPSFVPDVFIKDVHEKIIKTINLNEYTNDVSYVLSETSSQYTDPVHVTQNAKYEIAKEMISKDYFKKIIASCSL